MKNTIAVYWVALGSVCLATTAILYLIITLAVNYAEPFKQEPVSGCVLILVPMLLLWLVPLIRFFAWAATPSKAWRWYSAAAAVCLLLASSAIGGLAACLELYHQTLELDGSLEARVDQFLFYFPVLITALVAYAVGLLASAALLLLIGKQQKRQALSLLGAPLY